MAAVVPSRFGPLSPRSLATRDVKFPSLAARFFAALAGDEGPRPGLASPPASQPEDAIAVGVVLSEAGRTTPTGGGKVSR